MKCIDGEYTDLESQRHVLSLSFAKDIAYLALNGFCINILIF